ncbi:MAG: DUF434 domain-containing protein, partial [Bacteroidales bacterium]|nr:DUF434 domain-containing protein [Bacteroidales bacterium]
MNFSKDFQTAVNDYLLLLDKKYPQKAILKLIGDRYALNGTERSMLYRGITTSKNAEKRAKKLISEKNIINQPIHIDGYNVLITIGSYLNGNLVFIGNDRYLRDASEIHGKIFRTELFERAVILILVYLEKLKVSEINFYLDQPVSFSGKLSQKINKIIKDYYLTGKAEVYNSPDYILKNIEEGFVATTDSTIIDKAKLNIFDIARNTIKYHFNPNFIDMG